MSDSSAQGKTKYSEASCASNMMSNADLIATDIEEYLRLHEEKEILKFLTCGSVDDGKSTLIGRLLHDTNTVYEDHLDAVVRDSKRAGRNNGEIDLSLLVDGLQAEREQGITIDVAYRYFSSEVRKFIIADCPGHVQYTRNMATGASNCDLAVILIDAQHGVLPQTKHHTYVANLLGIRHVVIAVNKMDLVDYDQKSFESIRREFRSYLDQLAIPDVQFIPLSAKLGDNVVERSKKLAWYDGPTLLTYLHSVPLVSDRDYKNFRMVVQRVNRPDDNFRGYSGTLASGFIRPGQSITVMPSGLETKIERIVTMDGDLEAAYAPMSVTLTLSNDLDISRGDVMVDNRLKLDCRNEFLAKLVWMDDSPLKLDRKYIVKHGASQVIGTIEEIQHRIHIDDLSSQSVTTLNKNDVGRCKLSLDRAICFDSYQSSRMLGGFILIDRLAHRTVAAGMIEPAEEDDMPKSASSETISPLAASAKLDDQSFGVTIDHATPSSLRPIVTV